MRFKLDENLSRHLKKSLSEAGHDAVTAADEDLLARPDTDIAAAASAENRVLLTLDTDFADVRKYPPGSHPGIILFRPATFGPLSVNRFVQEFIEESSLEKLAGCLVVVEPGRVRYRQPDE